MPSVDYAGPLERVYDLAANERVTVDARSDPELGNQSFGIVVRFDQRGAAERAGGRQQRPRACE